MGPEGVEGALEVAGTAGEARPGVEGAEKGVGVEVGGGELLACEGGEGLVAGVDVVDEPGRDGVARRGRGVGGVGGGQDRVGGGERALLGVESGEERVGGSGLGRAAALFAKTREENLVGERLERGIRAGEVEVGERLRVGVVQLTDVRV